MATIQNIIERVEERLALVSGLDVQIHAEGRLIEYLRSVYYEVFEDHWNRDFMSYTTGTLDGTTGKITDSLASLIRQSSDLHSVFYESDPDPLPELAAGTNPTTIRRRCINRTTDGACPFTLYPVTTTGDVHIWYRTRIDPLKWSDGEYAQELYADEEALLHGVTARFLVDDDTNPTSAQTYASLYQERMNKLRKRGWALPISKRPQEVDGPTTRWL